MTEEERQALFVREFTAWDRAWRDHRLRARLGRDLYPTAWGDQWSPETWQVIKSNERTLDVWLELAFRNVFQNVRDI